MIIKKEKIAFNVEVPIVDNEISNDITAPPGQQWKYEEGDIICSAIAYGDTLTLILREHGDDLEDFKKELKKILEPHKTLYAFNYMMEKGNFKGFLGISYWVEEIKPFKGKGKSKEWFFQDLVKDKKVSKNDIPSDPLNDNSAEVLNRYKIKDYDPIIKHNIADVLKQYFIWKNKNYLIKKYEDRIDSKGWFI